MCSSRAIKIHSENTLILRVVPWLFAQRLRLRLKPLLQVCYSLIEYQNRGQSEQLQITLSYKESQNQHQPFISQFILTGLIGSAMLDNKRIITPFMAQI